MGNISQSFYRDLRRARSTRHADGQAAKPVMLQRLTLAGTPSKAHDAKQFFNTEAEAQAEIDRIRALNPGRTLNYQITNRNEENTK